jgi:hypothetical protein
MQERVAAGLDSTRSGLGGPVLHNRSQSGCCLAPTQFRSRTTQSVVSAHGGVANLRYCISQRLAWVGGTLHPGIPAPRSYTVCDPWAHASRAMTVSVAFDASIGQIPQRVAVQILPFRSQSDRFPAGHKGEMGCSRVYP